MTEMKIIDLSHKITQDMPLYPGTGELFKIEDSDIYREAGVNVLQLSLNGHIGTHLDSPRHLFPDGKDLTEIDISKFYGRGVVIECSEFIKNNEISSKALSQIDNLNLYKYVLLCTNWSKKWGRNEYFENFPVISEDLARTISESEIIGLGVDVSSVDPVDADLINHRILLGSEKIIIENMTNLGKLVNKNFTLSCFPLNIEGGDGSPIRAAAVIE